jgi:hypothetical protein
MKKLLLFAFILSSVASQAEWLKGNITFKDNNVKSGYVKYFDKADAKKIEYKTTLNDKSEFLPSEGLKMVEFQLKDGGNRKLIYLHLAHITGFTPKLKTDKECLWFGLIYEGDFNVLSIYCTTSNGAYMTNGTSSTLQYYINWPEEDFATLTSIVAKGMGVVIGNKKYMKETNKLIFKGKCDKMIEALDNETFKPKKIEDVIDYYKTNCGNKNK